MLDPKKAAAMDQNTNELAEMSACLMWSLYNKFVESGFSDEQAFLLTRDYLITFVAESHRKA